MKNLSALNMLGFFFFFFFFVVFCHLLLNTKFTLYETQLRSLHAYTAASHKAEVMAFRTKLGFDGKRPSIAYMKWASIM